MPHLLAGSSPPIHQTACGLEAGAGSVHTTGWAWRLEARCWLTRGKHRADLGHALIRWHAGMVTCWRRSWRGWATGLDHNGSLRTPRPPVHLLLAVPAVEAQEIEAQSRPLHKPLEVAGRCAGIPGDLAVPRVNLPPRHTAAASFFPILPLRDDRYIVAASQNGMQAWSEAGRRTSVRRRGHHGRVDRRTSTWDVSHGGTCTRTCVMTAGRVARREFGGGKRGWKTGPRDLEDPSDWLPAARSAGPRATWLLMVTVWIHVRVGARL